MKKQDKQQSAKKAKRLQRKRRDAQSIQKQKELYEQGQNRKREYEKLRRSNQQFHDHHKNVIERLGRDGVSPSLAETILNDHERKVVSRQRMMQQAMVAAMASASLAGAVIKKK